MASTSTATEFPHQNDTFITTSGGYGSVERDLVADVFAPAPTPLEWPVRGASPRPQTVRPSGRGGEGRRARPPAPFATAVSAVLMVNPTDVCSCAHGRYRGQRAESLATPATYRSRYALRANAAPRPSARPSTPLSAVSEGIEALGGRCLAGCDEATMPRPVDQLPGVDCSQSSLTYSRVHTVHVRLRAANT